MWKQKNLKLTHKSLDLAFSWCKEALVTSMISNVNTGFTLNWVHRFKAIFCTFLLLSEVLPDPVCQHISGRLPAPVLGEVNGIRRCSALAGVGLPDKQFKYLTHYFVFQKQF